MQIVQIYRLYSESFQRLCAIYFGIFSSARDPLEVGTESKLGRKENVVAFTSAFEPERSSFQQGHKLSERIPTIYR